MDQLFPVYLWCTLRGPLPVLDEQRIFFPRPDHAGVHLILTRLDPGRVMLFRDSDRTVAKQHGHLINRCS
jgi:hypothetical protein